MADVKVVVDCSTDPQLDSRLKEIASDAKRLIDAGNAAEAEPLIVEAKGLIEQQASAQTQLVPLTAAELTQRDLDAVAGTEAARARLVTDRDQRLRASDWTQLVDAVLPVGTTLQQWQTYRQELRDWTKLIVDPNAPPPWPKPPAVIA